MGIVGLGISRQFPCLINTALLPKPDLDGESVDGLGCV